LSASDDSSDPDDVESNGVPSTSVFSVGGVSICGASPDDTISTVIASGGGTAPAPTKNMPSSRPTTEKTRPARMNRFDPIISSCTPPMPHRIIPDAQALVILLAGRPGRPDNGGRPRRDRRPIGNPS
jgi:hypothetical protein